MLCVECRPYAKPVVVMSSKWLLHHRACQSKIEEFLPGTFFRRVIIEGHHGDNMMERTKKSCPLVEPTQIRKVIFCCGKVRFILFIEVTSCGLSNCCNVIRCSTICIMPEAPRPLMIPRLCAWSKLLPFHMTSSPELFSATPMPSWFGCRKNRGTWARGRTSNLASTQRFVRKG